MKYNDSSCIIKIVLSDKIKSGLYTIYYNESDSLDHDTPAMNANGKFIWCSKLSDIKKVYKKLDKKLKRIGLPKIKLQCTFDLQEIFTAPKKHRFVKKNGPDILDWVNLLSDYLYFLKDSDDKLNQNLTYIEMLSIYLFENSKIDGFTYEGEDGKAMFEQVVFYSIGKIMQNSIFI